MPSVLLGAGGRKGVFQPTTMFIPTNNTCYTGSVISLLVHRGQCTYACALSSTLFLMKSVWSSLGGPGMLWLLRAQHTSEPTSQSLML